MVEIYNDEEQVERIKAWMKEYLPTISVSILVVVIVFFGWRYWRIHQENIRAQASIKYEQMLVSVMGKDNAGTEVFAHDLISNYPSTPYAKLAALILAKLAIEKQNYSLADTQLMWVVNNADNKAIAQIARNRAARVLIITQHPQDALNLLQTVDDPSYLPAIEAIRGDAYVALNNLEAARIAYKRALATLPETAADWPLLQMKLNNITQNIITLQEEHS